MQLSEKQKKTLDVLKETYNQSSTGRRALRFIQDGQPDNMTPASVALVFRILAVLDVPLMIRRVDGQFVSLGLTAPVTMR